MTEAELQDLSRRAAGCLPAQIGRVFLLEQTNDERTGRVCTLDNGLLLWLHESTEACSEIIGRVLWTKRIVVSGYLETVKVISYANPELPILLAVVYIVNDITLAFRVAILRALIALRTSGQAQEQAGE